MSAQDGDTERQRVSEVLDRVRAGVRLRQGELASLGEEEAEGRLLLLELKSREFIQEPPCVSPRPLVGRLLIFVRKAVFHLFLKWYLRPVLEQQNAFNQSASRLLQDLAAHVEDLARRLDEISRRDPR